jgi:N-acetylmuramoyl-L-alanine amidase
MKLKYLVIHCTATPEGREVTSDQIRHWHLDPPPAGRGWHQVGYTDLFHLNGGVERMVANNNDGIVDPWEITNGAVGINSISRHVVYAGGLTSDAKRAKDTRTPDQRKSMLCYVRDMIRQNPDILVAGHNQFAPKACPSFDVPIWLEANLIPDKNIYQP